MKEFICSFFLFFLINFLSLSQNISALRADQEKILSDIEQISKSIQSKVSTRENTLSRVSLVNQELKIRESLIVQLQKELSEIEQSISDTDYKINQLEKELEIIKAEYSKLLLDTYKRRNALDELTFYMSSTTLAESYQRYRLIKEYSRYRQHQGLQIVQSQQKLIALINHVKSQKEQKENRLVDIQEEFNKLISSKNEHNRLVNSLQSEEKWLRNQLKEKEQSAKKLENRILEYIKQAEAGSVGTDFEKFKGKLIWPVTKGVIVNIFGEHAHPILKNVSIKNNGIDIQCVSDDKVFVVHNGEISRIVGISGYNTTIIVRHGNYLSVYANISKVTVKQGDKVFSGDPIGSVFKDGNEDHGVLHFEIWLQNQKLNPMEWLIP